MRLVCCTRSTQYVVAGYLGNTAFLRDPDRLILRGAVEVPVVIWRVAVKIAVWVIVAVRFGMPLARC
ncbi:hypothetical protein Pla123a_18900 [Posidoniimonas polymericola]|uniref:Uncharacterized protein n=1 Tax=Posidoniimonas polymericola TaxID=2528002 RepID=A0A5C5YQP3_9BACT|nr:hypothetical protein Pla123a_18900 [Posidoniimonas polymericola]